MSPIRHASANHSPRAKWHVVTVAVVLLLPSVIAPDRFTLLQASAQQSSSSASVNDLSTLSPSQLLTRHMNAGEKHNYKLDLNAGQFTQIIIDQKGIDVESRAFYPDGTLYILTDNPNGFYGRETISIVAQTSGTYRIEVSSDKHYPAGEYDLNVEPLRDASAADEKLVLAERSFAEAQQLRRDASTASSKDNRVEDYNAAIKKYNEALALWREVGELRGQCYALTNIGRVYRMLGNPSPALEHLTQAVKCLDEAGDLSGQAFALNETGAVHREFGNAHDALSAYEIALKLRIELGDRYGQAQIYNNIGLAYSNIGYQPQAVENLDKALSVWLELGLHDSEMKTRINVAKARVEMGDLDIALKQYETVQAYCDSEIKNSDLEVKEVAESLQPLALNGIGLVYDTWANSEAAQDYYSKALELYRKKKISRGEINQGEADVLDNLGMLYAFLGDATQALSHFREALVIREQGQQPKSWGMTLSNLGYADMLLGNKAEALKHLTEALALSRRSGDKRFEAYTLIRMGMAYVALNDPTKALENYRMALAIHQDPQFEDRRGLAITLDKMGEAFALSADWGSALKQYQQAILRWSSVGDGQGQALSLFGRTQVLYQRYQRMKDPQDLYNARDSVEGALQIIEQLRNRVNSQQLQMIYFAGKQDFYALAIDVRIELYQLNDSTTDLEAALSISEKSRARNLLDLLTKAHIAPQRGMSAEDENKNIVLQRQIDDLTQSSLRFRSRGATASAEIVERLLDERMAEQDALLLSAKRKSSAQLIASQPLTTPEIQKFLDSDTLLLEFSLGAERSHVWVVSHSDIKHCFLPSGAEIKATAERFRRSIIAYEPQKPTEDFKEYLARRRTAAEQYDSLAAELTHIILEPVWSQLGNKRVVIVADGALQYIPFEALPVPSFAVTTNSTRRPTLLSTNEVVYEPSASTVALLRGIQRPNKSKIVAVIADPVFTNKPDGKLSAAGQGPIADLTRSLRDIGDTAQGDLTLARLEYSRAEADAIIAIARPETSMMKVGFQATREIATSPNLKQFDIIHFATHGILNDKRPELSGIVLSMVNDRGEPQDGFLSLRDIYKLDLPVHLVVLSACRTGVGQQVRGEGLIGLTRGFMYAGAQSLVVSLWRVDDKATAELMTRFYRNMLTYKLSAAAALARAKLEMQAQLEWQSPYFWAGFVLQGDWQWVPVYAR